MDYRITSGLLKEKSLSAKIYFLLLKKEMSASEISRIVYGNKNVQLSNILKAIQKLVYHKFVEEILLTSVEKENLGRDKREKLYRSTYEPIINFVSKQVIERNKTTQEKERENLSGEEIKILNIIFSSKWFSKFYENDFLKTQSGEISVSNKFYYSGAPIRFFALFLEKFFVISYLISYYYHIDVKVSNILEVGDFDIFLEKNKGKLEKYHPNFGKVKEEAVMSLGDDPETIKEFDYYFHDDGLFLIPAVLSKKLISIGRIPLTVKNHVEYAIREEKKINF